MFRIGNNSREGSESHQALDDRRVAQICGPDGLIDNLARRRNFDLVRLNGIRVWNEGFDKHLFRPYQIAWIFFRVSTRAQHKAPQK